MFWGVWKYDKYGSLRKQGNIQILLRIVSNKTKFTTILKLLKFIFTLKIYREWSYSSKNRNQRNRCVWWGNCKNVMLCRNHRRIVKIQLWDIKGKSFSDAPHRSARKSMYPWLSCAHNDYFITQSSTGI